MLCVHDWMSETYVLCGTLGQHPILICLVTAQPKQFYSARVVFATTASFIKVNSVQCSDGTAVTRSLAHCWRGGEQASWEKGKHCAHNGTCFLFQKHVHSDWSYECTANRVDVFERGIMLPGHSKETASVNTLCRLQLCTVLGRSDSQLPGHCCTEQEIIINQSINSLAWTECVDSLLFSGASSTFLPRLLREIRNRVIFT